jgi:hypothetical protein
LQELTGGPPSFVRKHHYPIRYSTIEETVIRLKEKERSPGPASRKPGAGEKTPRAVALTMNHPPTGLKRGIWLFRILNGALRS